jgi:hypothetical protein
VHASAPYCGIPPSNPFLTPGDGVPDEIDALGLRIARQGGGDNAAYIARMHALASSNTHLLALFAGTQAAIIRRRA